MKAKWGIMMNKRATALLLALALIFAPTAPAGAEGTDAAAGTGFSDVQPGDWYYDTVMDMVALGAVSGHLDGAFLPENDISVAEFCKMALEVLPGGEGINANSIDPEVVRAELNRSNPGYWANDVILASLLRGVDWFGTEQAVWAAPLTREKMVCALVDLYLNSEEEPELVADSRVMWLIGDYETAGIADREGDLPILWAYTEGLVGGVDENGAFDPDGQVSRAEACTVLCRFFYPERRLAVDWEEAERRYDQAMSAPLTREADGVDFTGMSRIRYNQDVAFDFCRQLEEEIGIQIFYLPEFTEKEAGILQHEQMENLPIDRSYFALVLQELQKMKEAYDLYPDGLLKEVIAKKDPSRSAEIILCPYTFPGLTSFGNYLYDQSSDEKKVDQIYYTGVGDIRYYSHEMGHMVMSCAAILGGWSTVCGDWEAMNQRATAADYVSAYAMTSRPEDWAETWAALWHESDYVGGLLDVGASVLGEKVRYMTELLDNSYDAIQRDELPWSGLLSK